MSETVTLTLPKDVATKILAAALFTLARNKAIEGTLPPLERRTFDKILELQLKQDLL